MPKVATWMSFWVWYIEIKSTLSWKVITLVDQHNKIDQEKVVWWASLFDNKIEIFT